MSLVNKTMICKLSFELLGTSGKDETITDVVNTRLGVSRDAGYYHKCKIDTASLKDLMFTVRAARATHRSFTRPFGDDKWRLIPATKIKEYTREIRAAKADFAAAVSDLQVQWPNVIARQKARLDKIKDKLFDPEDYPFVEKKAPTQNGKDYKVIMPVDLTPYYKLEYEMAPTPDEGHILIELEAETLQELKDDLIAKNRQKLEDSKLELWQRLITPVKNMAKICSEDRTVYKSLIKNIEKELSILNDLNVTNDIDLTNAIKEVKSQLIGYTPGQIRHDKHLKKDLGDKATALTDKMQHSMSGQTT